MRLGKLKWFLLFGAVFLMSGLCTSLYAAPKQEKVVKMKYDCYIINAAPTAALDTWLWDYVEKNSKGRIKIDRFYSSPLHKVGEHLPSAMGFPSFP
jgi:TRAP-type C4-dicarboxylate transport system substrate-binding protein